MNLFENVTTAGENLWNSVVGAANALWDILFGGAEDAGKKAGDGSSTANTPLDPKTWDPRQWATGGLVRGYASGGTIAAFPKRMGSDTVPSMLTPGEFVVNARAAQSNLDSLRRINAGGSAGGGGGVSVNITVNGGMLGTAQEARVFARAIDRELMRLRRDNENLAFDSSL